MRGFLAGIIGLSLMQAILSNNQAAGRVGGLLTGAGSLVQRLADPAVPAIPDLRPAAATPGPLASSGSGNAAPALFAGRVPTPAPAPLTA